MKIEDLSGLSDFEFEVRRQELITEYIRSLPVERRKSVYAFQLEIDKHRAEMSSEEFMSYCLKTACANLKDNCDRYEHISDLCLVGQAQLGNNKPAVPDYSKERRI